MKLLPPSQQLAVLAGAAHDADAAHALLDGPAGREPLLALDQGPVRACGALLGWYASSIRFRGVPAVLGTPRVFAQAVRVARLPAVQPAAVRGALAGILDTEAVRRLLARAWTEWPVVREEGVDLVWTLYERVNGQVAPKRRRTPSSTETANRAATLAFLNGGGADAA